MQKNPKKDVYFTRINQKEREQTIEMVTSLFISLLRTGGEIGSHEVDTLYPILENLFQHESISWESHLREISRKDVELEDALTYLNKTLITLDKIRIMLSLIALANRDNGFSTSDVTRILEMTRKLNLETEGFMAVMDGIEYQRTEPASIRGFRYYSQTDRSIFQDYVSFGRDSECRVRFRNRRYAGHEALLMMVDKYVFIGVHNNAHVFLNDIEMKPNRLYLIPQDSELRLGSVEFHHDLLVKIYRNRDISDVVGFRKHDYNFQLNHQSNQYHIEVFEKTVYLNGRPVPYRKAMPVYYDDTIQIKGYDPFNLLEVIRRREEIGILNVKPTELFLTLENDYYSASRVESSKTVAKVAIEEDQYTLFPPRKGWELFLNNQPVDRPVRFYLNTDIVSINKRQFRLNNFLDLIEIPFDVQQISVIDLKHYFPDGDLALDSISFEAQKGELISILGQSGCGKSTLLKCLSADIIPTYGSIVIDGKNLLRNLNYFAEHIGYVPQEDLLFANLTVFENLYFRGRIQLPRISKDHLAQKINNILTQTNLAHRRDSLVGSEKTKMLSGGERKRLNIALELLYEPTVIICDEPTSGLSSGDSEDIIQLLRGLANQGKIVILTIHQPSPDLFEQFDRVLLMDKEGKQVFFGTTDEAFAYFETELSTCTLRKNEILRKKQMRLPEYMYEIIEYPEYNEKGEITYVQEHQNVAPKRRFSPNYWRDKFKRKTLFDLIQVDKTKENKNIQPLNRKRQRLGLVANAVQLRTFMKRNLLMKMRNRSNLLITFGEAPILAFLLAFILRFNPDDAPYQFATNINIPVYLFITIIVFIFLGLSNSIEEILTERRIIQREKRLNMKISYYLTTKYLALALFSLVQAILYNIVTSLLLDLHGLFWITLVFSWLSGMLGFGFGILISCFIDNSKAVINILPIMLIPQIIFGGAIVQYERMNQRIIFFKTNPVPEIVQFIPSRWLFEGIYTCYAVDNAHTATMTDLRKKMLTLQDGYRLGKLPSSAYYDGMDRLNSEMERVHTRYPRERYVNDFIHNSVDFMDQKFRDTGKNVFLSSYKRFGGETYSTRGFNITVLMLYFAALCIATWVKLKWFFPI